MSDIAIDRLKGGRVRVSGRVTPRRTVPAKIQTRVCGGRWKTVRMVTVRRGRLHATVTITAGSQQLRVIVGDGAKGWTTAAFGVR